MADPPETEREMTYTAREDLRLAAAKRKASEIIYKAAANRSAGRLTDIGEYQTGLHYGAISKFLANFHERPSLLLPQVQRKLRALLKIEMQRAALELEFAKELQFLKTESLYLDLGRLAEKRKRILAGGKLTDDNFDDPQSQCSERNWGVDVRILDDYLKGHKGVPYFWCEVFRSNPCLSRICSERDWLVLTHLKDIRSKPLLTGGFKLEFRFSPNQLATDTILSKTFEGTNKFDRDRPYKFGGWSVDFISGRKIRWKEGMDPTIEGNSPSPNCTSGEGAIKPVKTESFFNFFAKPDDGSGISLLKAETQHQVGKYLHQKVIPYAERWFIGEMKH